MIIKNDNPIFYLADKIKYSARRGMLELDIMLIPYLDNKYMSETLDDKKLFIDFLTSEDSDIFDWLFKNIEPPEKYKQLIVKIINAKQEFNNQHLN